MTVCDFELSNSHVKLIHWGINGESMCHGHHDFSCVCFVIKIGERKILLCRI